jgi:hypothetical protein
MTRAIYCLLPGRWLYIQRPSTVFFSLIFGVLYEIRIWHCTSDHDLYRLTFLDVRTRFRFLCFFWMRWYVLHLLSTSGMIFASLAFIFIQRLYHSFYNKSSLPCKILWIHKVVISRDK